MIAIILMWMQLVAGQTYHRETIDSLQTSKAPRVEVLGTVTGVAQRQDKAITFRLIDEHGHAVGCVLLPGKGEQPRVGVVVKVSGVRHAFAVHHQDVGGGYTVVEIDPVEKVEEP